MSVVTITFTHPFYPINALRDADPTFPHLFALALNFLVSFWYQASVYLPIPWLNPAAGHAPALPQIGECKLGQNIQILPLVPLLNNDLDKGFIDLG